MNKKQQQKEPIKILLNFDYKYYPFTTASYFEMAASSRDDVITYRSTEKLPKDLDLVLNVEPVGEFVRIKGVPCAYYEIDNHVILGRERKYYDNCDILLLAQELFLKMYDEYNPKVLPLGFDPNLHRCIPEREEIFDIGFIGNDTYPERRRYLEQLGTRFKLLRTNSEPGLEYSKTLSSCKMLFNCSMNNDINMRVFESIGVGKLFFTDRIPFLDKYFTEDEHYIGYSNWDELRQKVFYYLNRACFRQQIARAGREYALKHHTYNHRLDLVLKYLNDFKNT